jgi:hypothetical protein
MLVAIHQPNFFPWLGYFDKIRRADVFIFLDEVDYPRSGSGGMGSWLNRVRVRVQDQPRWLTVPVRRMPLGSPVSAARIDESQPWRRRVLGTLEANYRRAPHYEAALSLIRPLVDSAEPSLAQFNMQAIGVMATHLGLRARFLRQSELGTSELGHPPSDEPSRGTRLLIELVKAVGGKAYLAGGGAAGYQQDDLFAQAGVELVPQNYQPTPYAAADTFLPGLSVIDYLMHDGRALADLEGATSS